VMEEVPSAFVDELANSVEPVAKLVVEPGREDVSRIEALEPVVECVVTSVELAEGVASMEDEAKALEVTEMGQATS